MTFYNEPAFWAFMAALIGAIRYLSKVIYLYRMRSIDHKTEQDMKVETFRRDNIQKSIDCLQGAMDRIEPLVMEHEVIVKDLRKSVEMVGIIEKNLTSMFASLKLNYEGFEKRVINVTAGHQLLVDRIISIQKEITALNNIGKVIVKK